MSIRIAVTGDRVESKVIESKLLPYIEYPRWRAVLNCSIDKVVE